MFQQQAGSLHLRGWLHLSGADRRQRHHAALFTAQAVIKHYNEHGPARQPC